MKRRGCAIAPEPEGVFRSCRDPVIADRRAAGGVTTAPDRWLCLLRRTVPLPKPVTRRPLEPLRVPEDADAVVTLERATLQLGNREPARPVVFLGSLGLTIKPVDLAPKHFTL